MDKIKKINKNSKNNLPMILIVLDGWGITKSNKGNAVTLAKTSTLDGLAKKYPYTELLAHGRHVGLPPKQDGNSEAGHMNIGAGRIVEQDAVKIGHSINDGTFFKNTAFLEAIKHVKDNKSSIHLMGMLSNGMSAHSDPDHLLAVVEMLKLNGIKNVYLHFFTDGRDSPKYVALKLITEMQKVFKNGERIATIMGRFYAMDRKKKWERTEKAYDALVLGKGKTAISPETAITESYNSGEDDEFIEPYTIKRKGLELIKISDNDSIIFFNLRSDRARQLAKVFVQDEFNKDNPSAFKRKKILKNICFVAMTDFGPDLGNILTAFPSMDLKATLPMVLAPLSQLYIAETEKYAHVTYFFNGGYAGKVDNENYTMVPSPDVRSYDKTPTMSSGKLTKVILNNLAKNKYEFTLLNLAAPDMIAHTGNLEAGITCCEGIDQYLAKMVKAYLKVNGTVIITSDHGNVEEMINLETGEIDTEHSSYPVPFIVVNNSLGKKKLKNKGNLADIAPTVLEILNINKPKEMTGESLLK